MNVFLHGLNTVLVFLVWWRLSGEIWPSGVVAALFAVHPLHVESVAWISQRKDLLSTFFWMLAIGVYATYARAPSWWRYTGLILATALALMSKPMAITLPLTLLMIDYWPLRRWPTTTLTRLLVEKIPLFLMSVIHTIITILVQREEGALDFNTNHTLILRFSNAVISYVRYISKMIYPEILSPFYPYPDSWPPTSVVGAISILAFLSVLSSFGPRWLAFGWLWFLVTLLPVIGLIQTGSHALADRYTYIPLLGMFTIFAWALNAWRVGKRSTIRTVTISLGIGLVLGVFGWLSAKQISIWKNADSVIERIATVAGNHSIVFRERSFLIKLRGGAPEDLENVYRMGLTLYPKDAFFLMELSNVEARFGRFEEAKSLIERARQLGPTLRGWQFHLGEIYMLEGNPELAISTLNEALKMHPTVGSAHGLIGRMRMGQGRFNVAVEEFQKAVAIDRWDWLSHNELGVALFYANRPEESLRSLEWAHWIDPKASDLNQNLNQVRKAMESR